jgi:cullin-4
VILLLFNKSPKLDYKDIKSATGIEDEELRRTLQSLACGKVRVLVKPAKGKDVTPEDVFYWNKTFSAKLYRLKINSIQIEETVS